MRTCLGREGSENTTHKVKALQRQIPNLQSQLDPAAQTIMAKDNDVERLDQDKAIVQQILNRVRERMREGGVTLCRDGV